MTTPDTLKALLAELRELADSPVPTDRAIGYGDAADKLEALLASEPNPDTLKAQLISNRKNERHHTASETAYWCRQWRLLAEQAIEALLASEPTPLVIDRDANLRREMRAYLDTLTIHGDNIGDIRRSLFMPFDSVWNGWVRDDTAEREQPCYCEFWEFRPCRCFTPPAHRCGVRGFADSGDTCPGCVAAGRVTPPAASADIVTIRQQIEALPTEQVRVRYIDDELRAHSKLEPFVKRDAVLAILA